MSKSVIFYAEIVTLTLENRYTWYSKFCEKFLNRIQMHSFILCTTVTKADARSSGSPVSPPVYKTNFIFLHHQVISLNPIEEI
jgi:hypothetical protein